MSRIALLALIFASPAWAAEVNIYSHRQPELIQPLLDQFTAETGIAVNVAFVDKGMAERLKAEGDRSPADLVLTVDIGRLIELTGVDVLQPVENATLQANIPAEYRERMAKVGGGPPARLEGIKIAQEALAAVKHRVAGAYVMPPFERFELALEVVDGFTEVM